MVYNTQIYWVFGLCPSSGFFLNNNEKNTTFQKLDLFPSSTDPVSETLCFSLLFRKNPDDGQSPKTQYICLKYTLVDKINIEFNNISKVIK
jgi:hypothetical protein